MLFDFLKKPKQSELNIQEFSSFGARQDKRAIIQLPQNDTVFLYHLRKSDKENQNTAFYKNGYLYNVYPRNNSLTLDENRDVAYFARFIICDGKKYDLCNPKDVIELKMPNFEKNNSSFSYVTRNLAYIFKMRAQRIYQKELAVPIVFTAVNLMLISGIGWQPKDFERLISQLERLEEYYYATILRDSINSFQSSLLNSELKQAEIAFKTIDLARQFDTDLVVMPYLGCSCEECAKYQGRVYSITGKDKRYPKLPDVIRKTGKVHPGCHHSIQVFYEWEKITKYIYNDSGQAEMIYVDPIQNSNRPFRDDRSVYEKRKYEESQQKRIKKESSEIWDAESTRKYAKRVIEYEWIEDNLPDLAPKSLGGYTRMKHTNSKNYQRIKEKAAELGKVLDDNI